MILNDETIDQAVLEAAWRYQLIAPLLKESDPERRRDYRDKLISQPQNHPWRGEVTLSPRTLRRWCQKHRERGLKGLLKAPRQDRGRLKAFPMEALERALELRDEDGRRTVPQLLGLLKDANPEWGTQVARSTLDRHLRARGCFRKRQGPEGPFGSFEAEEPNLLWQGDVCHGPEALFGGELRRCRIVGWLDDHSRFFCHLAAYPDEALPSIEDSLKRAILKYGLPSQIFVDNAMVYSGKAFSLACAELGIAKIHSTPRYPVSRGKIERAFRTLRDQLLGEVENLEPLPGEELNRYLRAWADKYHRRCHSGTGESPRARFRNRPLRQVVSTEHLEQAFWQWDRRKVSPHGEIKFAGNVYRCDPSFAGRKRVIRFDPFDLSRIYLWQDGQRAATATPTRLLHRRRPGQPARRRTKGSEAARRYLEGLVEAHDERLARELNLTSYPDSKEEQTDDCNRS